MNGAAALPENTRSTPRSNRTSRIGSSHHFLLCRRNAQYSPRSPARVPSRLAASNSFPSEAMSFLPSELSEIRADAGGPRLGQPEAVAGGPPQPQRVAAAEAEGGHGRHQPVVDGGQEDVRHQPPDREHR